MSRLDPWVPQAQGAAGAARRLLVGNKTACVPATAGVGKPLAGRPRDALVGLVNLGAPQYERTRIQQRRSLALGAQRSNERRYRPSVGGAMMAGAEGMGFANG
jgi:hypothetical protein